MFIFLFLLPFLSHISFNLPRSQGNEYEGENIINLEQLEFLCPVCRRLSNTLVPLIPDTQLGTVLQPPPQVVSTPPEFDEWFRSTVQMFSSLPQPPAEHKPRFIPPTNALDNAIDAFVTRSVSVASSAGHESVTPDEDATPYVWNALSYTIAAYEQAVRQVTTSQFLLDSYSFPFIHTISC